MLVWVSGTLKPRWGERPRCCLRDAAPAGATESSEDGLGQLRSLESQARRCGVDPPGLARLALASAAHAVAPPSAQLRDRASGESSGGLARTTGADLRRRARLIRYIQESDAQAPFVSGELRQALSS